MNYRFAFQIKRFLQKLQATRRAETTVQTYRRSLYYFRSFAQDQGIKDDLRAVSENLVSGYREHIHCQTDRSVDWKIRFLSVVKSFLNWLAEEELILSNPTANIVLPKMRGKKLPAYLTQEEIRTLMEAADPEVPAGTQTSAGLRDRAILETLYSTGMRASECYRLQIPDINFADGLVRINYGKGSKDRIVPIGSTALHFIERYITEVRGSRSGGALFRKPISSQPIDAYDLRQILKRYSRKAGIKIHLHPHLLRHSFAVHLLENGADIRYIQQMLGHENLIATQIYTRVVPVQLKKAHAAAHPATKRKEKLPAHLDLKRYYKNRTIRKDKGKKRAFSSSR